MDFNTLYKELFKPVFAYIVCRVTDRAVAEDLSASVWRKAFEKQNLFDPVKGTFRQWIFTIARNEINGYYRLYYVKKIFSLTGMEEIKEETSCRPEEAVGEQEESEQLLKAFSVLSKKERDLVGLKFYSGMSNREIARQTGLSESNVGTILHRCVVKLRKEMDV